MSVILKISYEDPEELDRVLEVLHPILKSYKVASNNDGTYRKAYAYIKETDKAAFIPQK